MKLVFYTYKQPEYETKLSHSFLVAYFPTYVTMCNNN